MSHSDSTINDWMSVSRFSPLVKAQHPNNSTLGFRAREEPMESWGFLSMNMQCRQCENNAFLMSRGYNITGDPNVIVGITVSCSNNKCNSKYGYADLLGFCLGCEEQIKIDQVITVSKDSTKYDRNIWVHKDCFDKSIPQSRSDSQPICMKCRSYIFVCEDRIKNTAETLNEFEMINGFCHVNCPSFNDPRCFKRHQYNFGKITEGPGISNYKSRLYQDAHENDSIGPIPNKSNLRY